MYFTFRNFFFFYYEQSHLLDRFSRSLHQMEGICVNFHNLVQFFRFLKGRCHDNQFFFVLDLFARSQSISGPIFTILHRMVSIELQMINTIYFFRYIKGRCQSQWLAGVPMSLEKSSTCTLKIPYIHDKYTHTPDLLRCVDQVS